MIRELTVISGKGGTGKTSIVASFALLAENAVLADCDVDAADLHLILAPEVERREVFRAGRQASIRQEDCVSCGECLDLCRYGAILRESRGADPDRYLVDPIACEGCGVCVHFCPVQAIDFPEQVSGELYVSRTRCGPMVHARLGVAAENSGKLVTAVRREAKNICERDGRPLLIVDGPPGIGCPVIASITGASQVLVVTEPTLSGEHDLHRVLSLAGHFGIVAAVCVNKWDLNPSLAERIEETARTRGALIAGRIPYDADVTRAQVQGKAAIEYGGKAAGEIRRLWESLRSATG